MRVWMAENNVTQEALAKRLNTSQTTVSAWLAGRMPDLKSALLIESEAGIPVAHWSEAPRKVASR